jgi:hypothetical protein
MIAAEEVNRNDYKSTFFNKDTPLLISMLRQFFPEEENPENVIFI